MNLPDITIMLTIFKWLSFLLGTVWVSLGVAIIVFAIKRT